MKLLSKALFLLYLLMLLWLVLFKFSLDISSVLDHQVRSLNVTPFAYVSSDNLKDVIYNFAVFIPFGLLVSLNLKQTTFWRRLVAIVAFSFAVEVIQYALAIGATDVTDVITNTFGGLLGLLLYSLSNRYIHSEKLEKSIVVTGTIVLILCIFTLGALFARGVQYQSAPGSKDNQDVRDRRMRHMDTSELTP